MNLYSIDTSALVDGMNRYYRPIVFRSLWERIDQLIEDGRAIATEEVRVEIERKEDRLAEWCKQHDKMFVAIDEAIQPVVTEILTAHRALVKELANRSTGDPFVIALAKVKGAIVLTGERPSQSLGKPRIPDVCDAMGIRWMSLMDMMEAEGWSF